MNETPQRRQPVLPGWAVAGCLLLTPLTGSLALSSPTAPTTPASASGCGSVAVGLASSLNPNNDAGQEDAGQEDLDKATEKKLEARTLRDLDKVADLCRTAIEKGLDEESNEFAKNLWASSLFEYATRLGQAIFEQDPPDRRWQFYRRQALTRLDKATELRPEWPDAYLLKARYHALAGGDRPVVRPLQVFLLLQQQDELPNGDLPAARTAIEQASESLKADETDPRIASQVYTWRAALSDDAEARLEYLNQAMEAFGKNVDALQLRSLVQIVGGNPEAAAEDFRLLMEIEPENGAYRQSLIEALTRAGEFDAAIGEIDKLIENQPDNPALHLLKARLQLQQEQTEEALASLNRVLELEPEEIGALLLRSRLYLEQEKFDEARADVDKILELQPEFGEAIFTRSMINTLAGDYATAIEDLVWLNERAPGNPEILLRLALLFYAEERYEDSIKAYSEVLELVPDNFMAQRGRGDVYLSLGKHEEAKENYENAYELNPEDSALLNNFAWLLATSPEGELRDGERATEMALKACELTEYDAAHILSTLASGYAEQGDFEKAKEWAAKAVEASEDEEQRERLQEELESYQAEKAWRERESAVDGEALAGPEGEMKVKKKPESQPEAGEKKSDDKSGAAGDAANDDQRSTPPTGADTDEA